MFWSFTTCENIVTFLVLVLSITKLKSTSTGNQLLFSNYKYITKITFEK